MKARLTRLAYSLASLVALAAAFGAGNKWHRSRGDPMRARLARLAYSLTTLAAFAAALGAGSKWR